MRVDEELFITIKEGQTARVGHGRRHARPLAAGRRRSLIDEWSDAEMVDNLDYTLFPNFHPWGAFNRIVYRFRPNGDDHRSQHHGGLLPRPLQGERPPPAPIHWLGVDEPWTDAPELGVLGKVFEQDTFNMARVQLGLESTRKPGITLANYQESKVRWSHQLLDEWMDDERARAVSACTGSIHPFSQALYEQDGEGNVQVTTQGRSGRPLPARRLVDRGRASSTSIPSSAVGSAAPRPSTACRASPRSASTEGWEFQGRGGP